jgi:hypothetical protein
MREEIVRRRRWVTEQQFLDLPVAPWSVWPPEPS